MSNDRFVPSYDTCDKVSELCPVKFTIYQDYLSTGANAFFATIFVLIFLVQVVLGLRGRFWSYTIWMGIGVGFESVGYIGRILESKNPWVLNTFIVEYLTLLLAPTLIAAAISITFKHLVLYYGTHWSLFRPALYPWVFVGTDFLSIFIQVVGGGAVVASTSGERNETIATLGEALVIGGVCFQVLNMVVCSLLMLIYYKRRKAATIGGYHEQQDIDLAGYRGGIKEPGQSFNEQRGLFRHGDSAEGGAGGTSAATAPQKGPKEIRRAKMFVRMLAVAYPLIIVRCSYRYISNLLAHNFASSCRN